MSFARKRILVDIKNIRKNEDLEKCGIHVKFNEDNIFNAQALIIGPKDTPYENGFYFFDINFPSDYPMNPPKVKFCTLDGRVRFNLFHQLLDKQIRIPRGMRNEYPFS